MKRKRVGRELKEGTYINIEEGIDAASSDEYHDFLRVDGPDRVTRVSLFGNHAITSILEHSQINRDPMARGKLRWFPTK